MSPRAMLESEKIKEAEKKWRQWKPNEIMELTFHGKVINHAVTEDGSVFFDIHGQLPLGAISDEEKWAVIRQFHEDYAGVLTIKFEGERNSEPIKYSDEWLKQNLQETGNEYKEKKCPHCNYGHAVIDTLFNKENSDYKHYICYRCNKRWKVKKE